MLRFRLFALFSILIIIMAANHLHHVCGDQPLINQVCGRTPAPAACQRCIRQDRNRFSEDRRGLGRASITCSSTFSYAVSRDFDDIANNTEDTLVKDVCLRCQFFVGNAILSLQRAQRAWDAGNYKEAAREAEVAINNHQSCQGLLQGFPAPPSFFNDFSTLKNYYQVAASILSQL